MSEDRDGPPPLAPVEAAERFLSYRQRDAADETLRTYRKRLDHILEFCQQQGIETIQAFGGWEIDEYERWRTQDDIAPTTLKGELATLRVFLKYCGRIGLVDEDLYERVEVPNLSVEEESSDVRLTTEQATALLDYYRNHHAVYATKEHTLLEVLWHTGARRSGVKALDLDDVHLDEQFLAFEHRREQGTPLKNDAESSRTVKIPETVCAVLEAYIARDRPDKRDEYGREPLFATRQGRASGGTLQSWCYLATHPCLHQRCPHGNERPTCRYRDRDHASKCPSARSPHHVRTGSMTWHRDRGVPLEVASERLDASPSVLERFYDKANRRERMEKRRSEFTSDLDITDNDSE